MKSSKGFTLIELLAVIVILAIIALIAAPVILNIIDDARKSSARDSALGVVSAAKLHFAQTMLNITAPEFTTAENAAGRIFDCDPDKKECATVVGGIVLKIEGTIPDGNVRVDNAGVVSTLDGEKLKFNGKYCFTITGGVVSDPLKCD